MDKNNRSLITIGLLILVGLSYYGYGKYKEYQKERNRQIAIEVCVNALKYKMGTHTKEFCTCMTDNGYVNKNTQEEMIPIIDKCIKEITDESS